MADIDVTLQALAELNRVEASIIKLSEQVASEGQGSDGDGGHDSSLGPDMAAAPASLEADLQHYKDLFSKLRFSYIEQVTKEKFIRAITADPPLVFDYQENIELEQALAVEKADLKALKTGVAELVDELAQLSREISRRYEKVQSQTRELQELPTRLEQLRCKVQELRDQQHLGEDHDRQLHLPLDKTLALVEAKDKERRELQRQLEALQSAVPRKTREVETVHTELIQLEAKRTTSTAAAKEAKRRKDAALGGVEDDLEERGRWWRGVERGLISMLAVET